MSLINSIVGSIVGPEDQVYEVTLLNPYTIQNFHQDKLSILDIKAKSQDGKWFNVEIQLSDEADYDKQALYYWTKLYTEQRRISQDYSTLSKAIDVHILNFTSILNQDKHHNVFHIREEDSGHIYFKDLELRTLELKKLSYDPREDLSDILSKIKNDVGYLIGFFDQS